MARFRSFLSRVGMPPAILVVMLVAVIGMAFALSGCGKSPTDPSAVPSPSPVASPTPVPPVIDAHVDINVHDASTGQLIQQASPGQVVRLKASITCYDRTSHLNVDCPFIREWKWQNLSNPDLQAGFFGEVTSDHPLAKADGDGTFFIRTSPIDYDGNEIGESPIFELLVTG